LREASRRARSPPPERGGIVRRTLEKLKGDWTRDQAERMAEEFVMEEILVPDEETERAMR